MKNLFIICLAVVLSLFPPPARAERELITIGVITPLTGPQAGRGKDISKLLTILEEQLNTPSSQYRYHFAIDDGKCGIGNSATSIGMKFIHVDKIRYLLTTCSGETLQVGNLAERQGVLTIAVLSNHQDVRKLGDYVFRTFVDIEQAIRRFSKYLKHEYPGPVAILSEENSFTLGMKDLLLQHLGAQVVYAEDFRSEVLDFQTLLSRVKATKATAVYFNVVSEGSLAALVNQAKALHVSAQIFSYVMPEATTFRRLTKENSNGLLFIGNPIIKQVSPDYQQVYGEFEKRYGKPEAYDFVLRTTFDAVRAIVQSIEAVGPDPAKGKEFLKTYRAQGALGTVEFDETGDIKNLHYLLKRVEPDGTFSVVDQLDEG